MDYTTDKNGNKLGLPPGAVVGQARDWNKLTQTVHTSFIRFIQDIIARLNNAGLQDLGYTANEVLPGACLDIVSNESLPS
jgi:hypothetical protein